mmetsp:Transcript_103930/g.323953  ORF Transcript_103930/g.323953 Transcript_103930/m.323953 type:complete len:274 (+) Transcript_103930:129-950(+)
MGQLCEHCFCDAESIRQERLVEQTELDARLAERLQAEEFELHAAEAVASAAARSHRASPRPPAAAPRGERRATPATGTADAAAGPSTALTSVRPQRFHNQERVRQQLQALELRSLAQQQQQQQRAGVAQTAQQGQQQSPQMMSHFLPGLVIMQHPSPQSNSRADALGLLGELFGQHQVRDPAVLFELFGDLEAVPRGVDPGVVEARTTTLTYDGAGASSENAPQSQCCVCLEQFRQGEELRMLPCMHRYHRECIDRWLTRSPACPVCKHDISR